MTGTGMVFLAFVAAVALAAVLAAARYGPAGTAKAVGIGLPVWLGYVGVLSALGVVRDPALRPPGIVYIVGPVVLFISLAAVRSRAGGRIARALPLWLLIGFQTYRVGVELVLHQLWVEGLVPKMLTFEGANVDIWIGASAPLAAWVSTKGRNGERLALAWNWLGLAALANVVVRSALTAPEPLNLIHAEVANRAIGMFPYTFIAGFLAPLAVTLHVLALRTIKVRIAESRPF